MPDYYQQREDGSSIHVPDSGPPPKDRPPLLPIALLAAAMFVAVAFFAGPRLLAPKDETAPKAAPTFSPTPADPGKSPLSGPELQDLAEGVALLIGSDDWSAAASMLQRADEQTGCDAQAFTSFRVPGDFAQRSIRREAVTSAAEHDWQVAFGHSRGRWVAVVQNCTEVPFV